MKNGEKKIVPNFAVLGWDLLGGTFVLPIMIDFIRKMYSYCQQCFKSIWEVFLIFHNEYFFDFRRNISLVRVFKGY